MNRQTGNLLLVEDNNEHSELAEFYINEYSENIQVDRVCDGAEAMAYLDKIEAVNSVLPWLILLDLNLPKYGGHELLVRIKTSKRLAGIPVVIFSTSNASQDVAQAFNNHANSYIVKPVDFEKFTETVHQLGMYWLLLNEAPG